jgi:hypothetical protein
MRIALFLCLVALPARAQIDDEPTPGTVAPPVVVTAQPAPVPPRTSGADVVLHLNSGNELIGRLLYGDTETVTLETRSRQAVTLPRNEIHDVRLAAIPTPETLRQRTGAHRLRLAGIGLLAAGAFCELMVALVWAAAVPISNASYSRGDALIGGGAADVAFGIVGAQLLVMGGVFYVAGRGEERRYSASGLSWRF